MTTTTRRRSDPRIVAFGVAFVLFSGGALLTGLLIDPSVLRGGGGRAMAFHGSFGQIFLANVSVALFLFSGAVTAGVTTLVGLLGLGAYVGSTMAVAVHNVGWAAVLGSTWTYVFIEFFAIVLAAAAGLRPIIGSLTPQPSRPNRPTRTARYLSGITSSLRLQLVAVGLLAAAAGIEASVISVH